ncbi:MAG: ribonuclease HII [bacterium]
MRKAPDLRAERSLWRRGYKYLAGLDEVGRGSWAGPLVAAAVILPSQARALRYLKGVRDSKQLTAREREALFDRIAGWCTAWSVGHASHEECDELGMSEAQRLAARRAIEGLGVRPDRVLLDGKWDFVGGGITERIVRGDSRCLSIAAASVLAKVTRDRIMQAEAEHHPWWWFDQNKGYPCPRHKASLRGVGPSAIHRRSWVFMDTLPWGGVPRLVRPDPQGSLFD